MLEKNEIVIYDDYAEIVLYNRKREEVARAIIDLEDVISVKGYRWHLKKYVYNGKTTLHRFILNPSSEEKVDHIDRNRLNNRKSNLRVVTSQENNMNRSLQRNNKSGVVGVSWNKQDKKWVAMIKKDGRQLCVGRLNIKEEVIKLRLQAELEYFGVEFAPQRHLFEEYNVK